MRALRWLCRDRVALFVAPLALTWLVWVGFEYARFSTSATKRAPLSVCLQAPEGCEGREMTLPLWQVVEIQADRFVVFSASVPVTVLGDTAGLEVGDRISLSGRFDAAEVAVREERREIHHLRRAKEILSGIGLLMALAILPWSATWRAGRLRLRG